MIDEAEFQDALACYKRDFVSKQWPREKWKWEAVKWFQDHWDMEAEDFRKCWKLLCLRRLSCLRLIIIILDR